MKIVLTMILFSAALYGAANWVLGRVFSQARSIEQAQVVRLVGKAFEEEPTLQQKLSIQTEKNEVVRLHSNRPLDENPINVYFGYTDADFRIQEYFSRKMALNAPTQVEQKDAALAELVQYFSAHPSESMSALDMALRKIPEERVDEREQVSSLYVLSVVEYLSNPKMDEEARKQNLHAILEQAPDSHVRDSLRLQYPDLLNPSN